MSGDPRFYGTPVPLALSTLTDICGGVLIHGASGVMATHISSLADAGDGSVVYIADEAFLSQLGQKSGFICLVAPTLEAYLTGALSSEAGVIVVANPRLAFAAISRALYADASKEASSYHETAYISPTAILGENVSIGAHCYIGKNVEVGDNVRLGIGVVLDDGVSIGASCTIDRGVMDDTILGAYVMLDNQVHIAHNVQIGNNTIIAAQVGVAGSTKIGRNCMFGGQVGVADHVAIGDNVIVAAQSGVTKDLDKPQLYIGYPAQPARDFWRGQVRLRKLIKNSEK